MYTYYIHFEKANHDIFKRRGNWRKYKKGDKKIDFVYVDRYIKFDKKFLYNLDVKIENFAMILEGENKREIVDLFLKDPKNRKYVPNQVAFNPRNIEEKVLNFIQKGKIYIAKPIAGASGENIEIIKNKKEFISNIPNFKKSFFRRDKQIKDGKNWVLQEYIEKPLLYKKRKFHIRAHVILSNEKKGFLDKQLLLYPSKKNYKLADFKNKDIHDSHGTGNKNIEVLKEDFKGNFTQKEYDKIKKGVIKICKIFIKKAILKCYEGLDSCFIFFGLDIMFLEDFTPIFIEANITPGIIGSYKNYHNIILEGVMQNIIDKKFPPKNKPREEKRFIKL